MKWKWIDNVEKKDLTAKVCDDLCKGYKIARLSGTGCLIVPERVFFYSVKEEAQEALGFVI